MKVTDEMKSILASRNITDSDRRDYLNTGGGCMVLFFMNEAGTLASVTDESILFMDMDPAANWDEIIDAWYNRQETIDNDDMHWLEC